MNIQYLSVHYSFLTLPWYLPSISLSQEFVASWFFRTTILVCRFLVSIILSASSSLFDFYPESCRSVMLSSRYIKISFLCSSHFKTLQKTQKGNLPSGAVLVQPALVASPPRLCSTVTYCMWPCITCHSSRRPSTLWNCSSAPKN